MTPFPPSDIQLPPKVQSTTLAPLALYSPLPGTDDPLSNQDSVVASESSVIIPPKTRKRTAAEAKLSSTTKDIPLKKRTSASAGPQTQLSPPTPLTTTSTNMDSDDDMLSNLSSDDDVLQDDSDNSADDGIPLLFTLVAS